MEYFRNFGKNFAKWANYVFPGFSRSGMSGGFSRSRFLQIGLFFSKLSLQLSKPDHFFRVFVPKTRID